MKPLAQQKQELSVFINNNNDDNPSVQPRIAAIKRKLQLDCDMNNQQTQTVGTEPVVKKIKENVATPKKSLLNGIHSTPVTPKIPPLLAERKQMLMNSANTDKHSPAPRVPMRLTPQQARQIKSPKLKKPMMYDENSTSIKASVKSPLANNGVTTIKSPLRDMRNQVLSPTINIQQIKASPKTATPTKSSASKKSLLRRLMASATPTSKSHSPRKLDTSMPSNNITMTSYKEPQECIDHLIRTLRAKGVECKQKKYVSAAKNKNRTFIKRKRTFIVSSRPNQSIMTSKWKRLTFLVNRTYKRSSAKH